MNDGTEHLRRHIEDVVSSWERERPDLDLSNFLLAICVMRLGRVLDDTYNRMCRKAYGISGADMRVLFALRRAGKPFARRPTDLFRALLVTSGAITKQVYRLSRLGFVDRLDDPAYPGGALIALTAKGLRAVDSATERLAKASPIAPGVEHMTTTDRATGRRIIQDMLEHLEQTPIVEGRARPSTSRPARPRRRVARA